MDTQKSLSLSDRLEPAHPSLSHPGRLMMDDELSECNESEWVFLNSKNGERLKSVDKVFQRVRKSAGLDQTGLVIHSLRHHGASAMLASGTDLATVRDILGHADISTTEKYLHASGQSLRNGADSIEGYLDRALNMLVCNQK